MKSKVNMLAVALAGACVTASGVEWQVLPMYGGGYMQNVIICPSNPKVWYSFADVGGPYRSDDAGGRWRPLHGNLRPEERLVGADQMRSMSVDPRDENNFVFVGGAYFDSPAGIYVTRDGGQSFRKRATARFYGNGYSKYGGNLVDRDPFNPDRLVAMGDWDGAFLSEDNGETWRKIGLAQTFCSDIRFDRKVQGRIWACAIPSDGKSDRTYVTGLYRSEDGGATWAKLRDDAPLEICQFRGRAEIVGYFHETGDVLISRDGGVTWAAYDEGLVKRTRTVHTAPGNYFAFGTGSDFTLIGDASGAIYRRGYDAATWTAVPHDSTLPGNLATEPRMTWTTNTKFDALMSLVVDPANDSHWLATDFYEIWESWDAGRNWKTRIQGIMQLVSHTIEFDPFSASNIVYGVADMGLFWSGDGGKRFRHPGLSSPSRGWVYSCTAAYSHKTPGRVMICGGKGNGIVLRSVSHGSWWQDPALRGLPKLDDTNPGVRAYSIAANYVREEYMICLSGPVGKGKGGVYRTFNGGDDWEWAGDGLPDGVDLFRHAEWAGGGVYSQIFFSADGSAVCHSSKTGQSWCMPAGSNAWQEVEGCPGIMCADRFRPGRMLAGAWPIRETLDGGLTWHKLKTNLGCCSYVYLDQNIRNLVIAGTPDRVVHVSYDGGTTFMPIADSDRVPSGGSSKVVVDRGRMYYLSTGSGVWNGNLPSGEERRHRVHSDALIWFRGGHDANGDGALQPGEFFDSAHEKGATHFQNCTIGGSGTVGYSKGPVWSAGNPLATNVQSYLSFPGGCSLEAVNPCATDEALDDYTIHLRFRWNGAFAPGSDGTMQIFGNGQNWGGQSGYSIKLVRQGTTGNTFKLTYSFGANGYGSGDGATGVTLKPGEWNDWFLLVRNVQPEGSASVRIVRCTGAGCLSDWAGGWYKSPWISGWKSGATRCCSVAMSSGTKFQMADGTFCGDIAGWTFWPKVLTDEEMREALSQPCPGDCVFRLGYENGSAREFAAEGTVAAEVSAADTWDGVPPRLDAANPTLTIGFDVGPRHAGLDQVLRVRAASGRAWLTAAIRCAADETWTVLATGRVSSAAALLVKVPAALLVAGRHQLRLTSGNPDAPVAFDVIELRGSWQMGEIVYYTYCPTGVDYFDPTGVNWSNGYNLLWGCWKGLDTSYPAVEDPLTSRMLTLRFDVPEEMTACSHTLHVSLNQWAGVPDEVRFYLNGELYLNRTGTWQYEVFAVSFPAGTFKPGENVLQVRHTGGPSPWWGSMRGLRMRVLDVPVATPCGFAIMLG